MRKSELVDDAERSRGILTPADREFLIGEREYEHRQTEHKRRNQIRERVYQSLLDLSFLFQYMDDSDLDRVFTPPPNHQAAFDDVLADALGLLYYEQSPDRPFEMLLRRGVSRAERKYAGSDAFDVEVDFDVRRTSPTQGLEDIVEQIERGEYGELAPEDLRTFIRFYSETDDFDPSAAVGELKHGRERSLADFNEALEQRQKARRVKQARKQDIRDDQGDE